MAEAQAKKILCPNLTPMKRALLLQTISTPGWEVVIEIANAACDEATKAIVRINPEDENADRAVVVRQQSARNMSEFSEQFFRSIHEHANSIKNVKNEDEKKAVDSVGSMFGIHPAAKKGDPASAIKNVYGIHPARPKKSEKK
jgi:hypothetical protein